MTIEVVSIRSVGRKAVCDLTVEDVNHYFTEQGVVSHNTGQYYSADNIYIIGRQQEKDGTEIAGYNFVINIEKSRTVKEKKKFVVSVLYDKGIDRYSGLLDIALESGHVIKPKMGWYARVNKETGEIIDTTNWREKATHCKEFWEPILKDPSFEEWIQKEFKISATEMLVSDESIDAAMNDVGDDDVEL
jgi:hypothetical protein